MNFYAKELRMICDTAQQVTHDGRARTDYLLELRNVSMQFHGIKALDRVDLSIRPRELFSIIGPNGAGKTSLLNCISGRYLPSAGQVLFDGRDVTRLAPNRRAAIGIGRTRRPPVGLQSASYGYIMEQGKVVLDGTAEALSTNEDVREFYLGGGERKSFKSLKSFKRRKRWL